MRTRRFGLVAFCVLLIGLFIGFAIAQGIGKPSVPEGDVALVEGLPDGENTVSEAELKHGIVQQAAQGGLKKPPKEGDAKFEETRAAALEELLDALWLQGQGEELGIEATPKEIRSELDVIKEQNFPTAKDFEKFLKESKLTDEDVDKRVKLQILATQIQQKMTEGAPKPSDTEIKDYYEAAKASQFTTKPTRDVRIITNKDKDKIEAARAALEADDSDASWKKIAKRFSEDPTTKSTGGLQSGLSEEALATAGPLKAAVFESALDDLVGPIKYQGNYTLVQVVKINSEEVQPLDEVRSQLESQLQQQAQQEFFESFVSDYNSKWTSRTICVAGLKAKKCSDYKGDGHPENASPACYEADPTEAPSECPAPVTSISPATPGSVTILQPQGERLPQRPAVPPAGAEAEVPPAGALPIGE